MASPLLALRARSFKEIRWSMALQGLTTIAVVATPTLILEESWHGRPMLDQPGHLWVVPTLVVAAAFALGGVVVARRTLELWRALMQGLSVGAVAAGTFLVADVLRRAMRHQAISTAVLRLFVEATLLSIVIAALGGAMGYLHASGHRST